MGNFSQPEELTAHLGNLSTIDN